MDTTRIPPAGDPFYAASRHDDHLDQEHDDTVEVHYSGLERGIPCYCFGGYVTITVEEDGQEHDEAVPCRRCSA
jgi:hypothetical protein